MKKLNRVKWIKENLFPVNIGFVNTKKAWKRLMKRMKIKNPPEFTNYGACSCFESDHGSLALVIQMNAKEFEKVKRFECYSVLSHEIKHAYDELMYHIGENKPSPEFGAYTIGWLVKEGAKAFKL